MNRTEGGTDDLIDFLLFSLVNIVGKMCRVPDNYFLV